jgi:hypothetical protein
MKASPQIKTIHDKKLVILDAKNTEIYINGIAFANYLLVLKHVAAKVNQDFAIEKEKVMMLK